MTTVPVSRDGVTAGVQAKEPKKAFLISANLIETRKLLGPEIGVDTSNGPYWLLTEDLLAGICGRLYPLFWNRAKNVNDFTSCWPWSGSVTQSGYGRLAIGKRNVYAHRVAYTLTYGPIPEGLQLDHLCRVRHSEVR